MNASALAMLKEAANKKKKAFKDPVVKNLKVTREQYLQEKAEEEAKKNKKKAFLMGTAAGDAGGPSSSSSSSSAEVQQLLQQVQQERNLLRQEKSEWMEQLKSLQNQMAALSQGGGGGVAAPSSSFEFDTSALEDKLAERIAAPLEEKMTDLRKEVARLRYQVNNLEDKVEDLENEEAPVSSGSGSASGGGVDNGAATEAAKAASKTARSAQQAVERLQERLEAIEGSTTRLGAQVKKVAANVASGASGASSDSVVVEAGKLEELEKRLTMLEVKQLEAAVQAEKDRKTRARSVPRRETKTPAGSPKGSSKPKVSAPNSPAKTTTNLSIASAASEKEAAPVMATSTTTQASVSSGGSGDANLLQPHTADDIGKAQARDDKLIKYLENPGRGAHTLYPKFSMSVKVVDGVRLVCFYKKVYIPAELRQKTLRYYHDTAGAAEWTKAVCKNAIWPSLDADITSFKA